MGEVLSRLMVVLGADTAAYQRDLGKAVETSKIHFDSIASAAKAATAALAGLFALEKIEEGIKQATEYADSMAHLSRQTGQTVEQLSAMSYALKLNDTAMEDYQEGIKKLSKNMVGADDANSQAAKTFADLGVKVRGADGAMRDSQAVFLDVADKIAAMKDGAEKTALEMELFGKSAGPRLQEMLNTGRAGITQLTDEAQKMGAVISTDTANAAADLKDSMERLHVAQQGIYMQMATELLPVFKNLADRGTDVATKTGILEKSALALAVAFKTLYTGASVMGNVLGVIGDQLGKVGAMAAAAASGDFAQLKAIWNDRTSVEDYKQSILDLGNIWNDVGSKASTAASAESQAAGKIAAHDAGEQVKKAKAKKYGKETSRLDELMADSGINSVVTDIGYDAQVRNSAYQEQLNKQKEMSGIQAAQLESLWQQSRDRELEATQEAERQKQQAMDDTFTFAQRGIDSVAAGHSKAAKTAQTIQKAQALSQIVSQTPVMAANAASAVASIPIIGPALALAASASMYALGAAMASDVMGGGKSGASGSSGVTPSSASNTVTPISQQPESQQRTILQLPADSLMTGRMIADLLDQALGDGKKLNNLQLQIV